METIDLGEIEEPQLVDSDYLIESGFGSLKRKYGSSVSGKSIASVKPEIYCKAIAHNLGLFQLRFSTEPVASKYL
jgi:hypothetical protein